MDGDTEVKERLLSVESFSFEKRVSSFSYSHVYSVWLRIIQGDMSDYPSVLSPIGHTLETVELEPFSTLP